MPPGALQPPLLPHRMRPPQQGQLPPPASLAHSLQQQGFMLRPAPGAALLSCRLIPCYQPCLAWCTPGAIHPTRPGAGPTLCMHACT